MIRFKIEGKRFEIASCWSDLSPVKLVQAIPFAYSNSSSPKTRLELLALLVPKLKRKQIRSLSDQERFDLVSLTDWVWETRLEAEAIPSFQFKGVEYFTPKPDLDDTVAIEFAMADLFLKEFVASSEPSALNKLVATLCRPRKPEEDLYSVEWDGVERQKYNGALADRRALEFAGLPLGVKAVVLQMFIQSSRFLQENYSIFSNNGSKSGQNGSKSGENGFDIGWLALLYDLAEQPIFGDFEKTCFTNMNTICLYLHNKSLQRKGNGSGPQSN